MAGVAMIMVASQLERVTGIPIEGDNVFGQLVDFAASLGAIHAPTFALALGVVVFLFAARRWTPWLPGPLIAVIGATVLVATLGPDAQGVALVGAIPSGLPPVGIPAVLPVDLAYLTASALGIALVAYTTTSSRHVHSRPAMAIRSMRTPNCLRSAARTSPRG